MSGGAGPAGYRQFQTPREDRSVLIDPSTERFDSLLKENTRLLASRAGGHDADIQGRPLGELADEARHGMLREAITWTRAYRDVEIDPTVLEHAGPLLLAGHQPELFHPGVWFKNVMLSRLARRHGAVGVNLLIDSDTPQSESIRAPTGALTSIGRTDIAIDTPGPRVPHEQRRVVDEALFASFGHRVAETIGPLVAEPMIGRFWPLVVQRLRASGRLGYALAQGRHAWESRWGLQTLEIPQSRICGHPSHGWLKAHLLAHLPEFQRCHNEVVDQYRQAHRIRGRSHPVPDLTVDGEWLEAPFWIYSDDEPRRRRLFARPTGNEIELTDRRAVRVRLPLHVDGDGARAVERLGRLETEGIRIRSRALITTLWARLALGDVFLHGIGGAKYDQVTDALIERFFGLKAPAYMVLSATLLLPVSRPMIEPGTLRRVDRTLRDMTWNPQRFLNGRESSADSEVAALVASKHRWIEEGGTSDANARQQFLEVRRINQALQPWVEVHRAATIADRRRIIEAMRIDRVLSDRQYAFCLYPESELLDFFEVSVVPNSP